MVKQRAVEPGTLLGGKYRVERELGRGGMGVVVAAAHIQLDLPVALKLLIDSEVDEKSRRRFLREARAASQLRSEHAVRVFDIAGEDDPDGPYIVMERLEGCDLAQLLRERGPLPLAEAVGLVAQAADAIAEAHAVGIVHRDLKPANLFVTRRRDAALVKVLDFGISRLPASGAHDGSTTGGQLLGSPAYMAPEQLAGEIDIDGRADLWSLGVLLYQLVSGRLPFAGDGLPQLCAQVMQAQPPPIPELGADWPAFERFLARCLHKQRERRFESIAALAAGLAELVPPGPVAEHVAALRRAAPGARQPAPATRPALATTQVAPLRSRRRLAPALGALIVLAAGIGLALAWRGSRGADAESPPAGPAPAAAPHHAPDAAVTAPAEAGMAARDGGAPVTPAPTAPRRRRPPSPSPSPTDVYDDRGD